MRRIAVFVIALLILAALPVSAQGGTIVDIASGVEDFSTLVAAVQAADPAVAEALSGSDPLTVFAPNNLAFANLASTFDFELNALLADQELVTELLQYHVIEGAVNSEQAISLDGQVVPTLLQDTFVGLSVVEGDLTLNGVVEVVQPFDVAATNGIIHTINDVIFPSAFVDRFQALSEAAPDVEEVEEPANANMRVAHFSPDTRSVDVFVDGAAVLRQVQFAEISAWLEVPAGSYEIAVAPTGLTADSAIIGPVTLPLAADSYTTVAAVGSRTDNTLTAVTIEESMTDLAEGSARVTVFHAIEDAPGVDVLAGGEPIVNNLAFPGSLGANDGAFTLDVAAGTYDLVVVPAGETEPVVLDLSGTELAAGNVYLVAAIGTLENPQVALAVTAPMDEGTTMAEETPAADAETETDMAEAGDDSIAAIAASDGDFSTLVTIITATSPDILNALGSINSEYTVFAPNNQAFTNLLATLNVTADELLVLPELVGAVLNYHVVPGEFMAEAVVGLDGESIPTLLEDATIQVTITDDSGVLLNGVVNVIETDIDASNGVIHVIDNVLLPQTAIDQLTALGVLSADN
jgi:transforming growth factor-beta-induced protein